MKIPATRLLVACLLAGLAATMKAQSISVMVDGNPARFTDVGPRMHNGRVMVPLKGVFEQMGASVDWNAYTRTVTAVKGETDVRLRVGAHSAIVDGRTVELDAPAIVVNGRTLVPLRFVSESLGADVQWDAYDRTVHISTAAGSETAMARTGVMATNTVMLTSGTVIPVTLNTPLSSNRSRKGDKFTATVDTRGDADYVGLPSGTRVEGHVAIARPKTDKAPGVLGLNFDRIRMPSGATYAIEGSLIGLDEKSVENKDGRLVAKTESKHLKYVGIGAGAGALVAIITKRSVLTDALIGGAIGFVVAEMERARSGVRDVNLATGTEFGVRLDQSASVRVADTG